MGKGMGMDKDMNNKTADKIRAETRAYFREGEYGIWIFGAALGISVILVGAVMLLILNQRVCPFYATRTLYI